VKDPGGANTPIDRFVHARLKSAGLAPSPEADRETLLRRVTLDLTGLPPTLQEMNAFLADQSPRAYEHVVDRLLASPAYGEHMARYWLDAARYADTHGLQRDGFREIWGYRDWVIAAFNRNLPFDQFIIEQLAGDLLPEPTRDQLVATGFNRCHVTTGETGVIEAEIESQNVVDRVTTFGTVFLGLTLDCTRCHDHKFDPLTMADFYSLYAYFNSLDGPALNLNVPAHPPVIPIATAEQQKALDAHDAAIAGLQAKIDGAEKLPAGGELEAAKQELARVQAARAALTAQLGTTPIWKETPQPRPAFILDRGLYDQPGEPVARRTPAALPPMDPSLPNNRLGLAKWLVDPEHPLTARIAVNRFWQQAFGTGLVKTSEDFGSQGEPPSHPELLDWLAVDFIESGWDVKALMKQIVMSATYRRSSRATPDQYERDPENRLLARGPRVRLDAEALRDQALAVSGLLVDKIGGPSVKPPQPAGLWEAVAYSGGEQPGDTFRFVPDKGADKIYRRTLYTFIKRTAAPPQLTTFDATARESCIVRRERTNTPLQALLLLNDPQFIEAARGLASCALREAGSDADRATHIFRRATGRRPSAGDLHTMRQGLERQRAYFARHADRADRLLTVGAAPVEPSVDRAELAAWTMTANLLLNLDEVITKN
jgi:hypothetical protein